MYDFHLHSEYSIDSRSSMEDMVISAIEKNLKSICFTDHVDFDSTIQKIDVCFREEDYFRNIKQVKYKYARHIEVLAGVEIGMQPHLFQRYDNFINNNPFDYVIMSIHNVNGMDINNQDYLTTINPNDILQEYYENMLACVKGYNNYDVLGHLDYIDRYLLDSSRNLRYDGFYSIIQEILRLLILNGKGLELNTSGTVWGLDYFHPKIQILKLYKELGGEIITIGSNAHGPDYVGYKFRTAEKILKNLGFKYIYIFKERKKIPINIG